MGIVEAEPCHREGALFYRAERFLAGRFLKTTPERTPKPMG